jgi:glutamate-ammonia-ligase adenylyltransferase
VQSVSGTSIGRAMTLAGQLAAMGFADTGRARRLTQELGLDPAGRDAGLLAAIAGAADPDLALAGLARLAGDAAAELIEALRGDASLRRRLIAVLGVSAALGDFLARHRGSWQLLGGEGMGPWPAAGALRAELLSAVGAAPGEPEPVADPGRIGGADPEAALRAGFRGILLRLAARDLAGEASLDEVMAALADLAAAAMEAALAIARARLPPGATPCRLAVIAMGKCGGRELNYASDVDVIFVAEPARGLRGSPGQALTAAPASAGAEHAALRTATRLATTMIRILGQPGADGPVFPVDPNLRPEGRDGPLVRTLASHLTYYQRWARTWEFQALLKARPAAGDAELGARYLESVTPLVWQAAQRQNFVAEVQAMRRRVAAAVPAGRASREIKLGPGGLRDMEFAVQLLQLVHGRTDPGLRQPGTLDAVLALAGGGYVGRRDAEILAEAYRFLRRIEHLLQLRQLRRTHTLPDDVATLRWIGRVLCPGEADPAAALRARWIEHSSQARRLHEKLFYRPLLEAVARLPGEAVRLTPEAARARLEALGYADPAGALRHIEALTAGVSRKAAIQRTLLPVLLGWFADAAEPDAGLLAFRQVSEALGDSPWYLRLLRDDTRVAQRLARVLASSRYATGLLLRAPEAVSLLADDGSLTARPADALRAEAEAITARHASAGRAAAGILALRRRELLRTAVADLAGLAGIEETGAALTTIAQVTIGAVLDAAVREAERDAGRLPTRIAVIAMGRLGGHEMGYASDADVVFVHDPLPGAGEEAAARAAQGIAETVRALLARRGPDPPLHVDAGLRPEGRQGPLVRTIASYRAYYRRWSLAWEAQALLRSEPIAGDQSLRAEFTAMADEIRYPPGGLDAGSVLEIRRIKARMEAERMPRGAEPALHLKLGPGGLADVEWLAQLLALRHAHAVAGLRTTRTLAALAAARQQGLITADQERTLAASWRLASRIRNAVMLVRGRGLDTVPTSGADLAAVARLLGYSPDTPQDLVEDYRRTARRARAVMEEIFYA